VPDIGEQLCSVMNAETFFVGKDHSDRAAGRVMVSG
jgi:hypothetical protein